MKDELNQMITDLKDALEKKTKILMSSNDFNSHTQGRMNNLTRKIEGLEHSANEIADNYLHHQDIRLNFKKRVSEIQNEIEDI